MSFDEKKIAASAAKKIGSLPKSIDHSDDLLFALHQPPTRHRRRDVTDATSSTRRSRVIFQTRTFGRLDFHFTRFFNRNQFDETFKTNYKSFQCLPTAPVFFKIKNCPISHNLHNLITDCLLWRIIDGPQR